MRAVMNRSKADRKITVLLRGGLGNQLFQYFTALEISNKFGGKLILDTSLLPSAGFVNRRGISVFPFELSAFVHAGEVRRGILYKLLPQTLAYYLYTRLAQLERQLAATPNQWPSRRNRLTQDSLVEIQELSSEVKHIKINSLCLSTNPKLEIRDSDLSAVSRPFKPTNWFDSEVRLIESVKPVAIHMRLGDHLRLGAQFDGAYVKRALDWLESQHRPHAVWVFSDQPDLAAQLLFSMPYEFRVIQPPKDSPAQESLALMAMAPSLIMGKSTFSYWAATVSAQAGNKVILNKEWLEDPHLPVFFKELNQNWVKV
jgi:hypothetical protein